VSDNGSRGCHRRRARDIDQEVTVQAELRVKRALKSRDLTSLYWP